MDKNTKKKQEINAILEKYNLKRTKTNAVTDNNFQITPKSDSQIIHVSKSLPTSTSTSPSNTVTSSPIVKTVNTPVNKINIEPDVKSLLDKDKKEIIKQNLNMPQAVLSKSNSKNTPKNFNLYDFIPTTKKETSSNTNNIDNLTKPTKQLSQSQQEVYKKLMQQKLIQQQNALQLQKQQHALQLQKQQHASQQQSKQPIKVIPKEAPIKIVSIDPTLSLDKSQDYKGPSNINNTGPGDIDPSRRTPSPVRNILSEQLARKQQAIKQNSNPEKPLKNITIDNSVSNSAISGGAVASNSKKQSLSRSEDNTNTFEISPELLELAKQRKALQEQQMLELKKFKEKKAQIINLNNRKKEIELMKSIEAEKQKLLKIQAKQHELNNIYNNQIQQSHLSNTNNSNQIQFTQPHQNTIKQIPYFEMKKTKKNITPIEVRDFVNEPKKEQDKIKDKNIYKEKEDTARKDTKDTKDTKELNIENPKKPVQDVKDVKELKIGEPLEYLKKKDMERMKITWPTKKEIYDETKFTEHLDTMTISYVKLFKNPKTSKDKTIDKDIHKFLKNNYNFKHLDEFKPACLKLIYKLLNYENIEIDIITH
jgi:hypothetical protein